MWFTRHTPPCYTLALMISPLLFNEIDIYAVMEEQKRSLKIAVAAAPELMASIPDEEVIATFVKRFEVEVPTLLEGEVSISEEEIDLDISGDPRRMIFDRNRPFYIKGTELTVHVPFHGEKIFFRVKPSIFSLSPPRGIVLDGELQLKFTFPNDSPPADLKSNLDRAMLDVKQHLQRLRDSAAQLHSELPGLVTHAWQQRKSQFVSKTQVVLGLGLPIRPHINARQPSTSERVGRTNPSVRNPAPTVPKEWDVFISHASEDKEEIAKPLAEALRSNALAVWYDEYALSVGDSLRRKIDEGLAKSKFGIVIVSPAFFSKHWPQQELNGLAAREVNGVKVILPVWHCVTQADVAAQSPTLADRLAVSSRLGLNTVVDQLLRAMKN